MHWETEERHQSQQKQKQKINNLARNLAFKERQWIQQSDSWSIEDKNNEVEQQGLQ